jgi:hypothetical protein
MLPRTDSCPCVTVQTGLVHSGAALPHQHIEVRRLRFAAHLGKATTASNARVTQLA